MSLLKQIQWVKENLIKPHGKETCNCGCGYKYVTSSAILDPINMYFESSMSIIFTKRNGKIDFLRSFQQKENLGRNLAYGFNGNALLG